MTRTRRSLSVALLAAALATLAAAHAADQSHAAGPSLPLKVVARVPLSGAAVEPENPEPGFGATLRKCLYAGTSWCRLLENKCENGGLLRDHAVHLEDLGVLAVHVDAVCPREVADVLLVRVPAVLL